MTPMPVAKVDGFKLNPETLFFIYFWTLTKLIAENLIFIILFQWAIAPNFSDSIALCLKHGRSIQIKFRTFVIGFKNIPSSTMPPMPVAGVGRFKKIFFFFFSNNLMAFETINFAASEVHCWNILIEKKSFSSTMPPKFVARVDRFQ